ncbi:MAG: DUF898 domain-containing protein [Paludibacteraceae bacterium]|nr:DUF898 domain-containing protein [Paludibacteraceae bacterium]
MEQINESKQSYKLSYHGKGLDYFVIMIVNALLTAITLSIYYPWARAKELKYIYGSTSLNGDRFSFSGTGKEMFIGYLKTILIFAIMFAAYFSLMLAEKPVLAIIALYVLLVAIIPLAVHGSYRYRMARTSWRGIRFGYRGDKKELILGFIKWFLLTIVTFGIYGAWYTVNLNNYVIGHIRVGNAEFKYNAKGSEYFWILIKGYFLTILTLGIYSFWWYRDIFNFWVDNLSIELEDKEIKFHSRATAGDIFSLVVPNFLIVLFTLGLGIAWAETRSLKFNCDMIEMEGDIDPDTLQQTEEDYKDALGEEMSDFFDIDLI